MGRLLSIVLSACFCIMLPVSAATAELLWVKLKDQADISSQYYTLGDIATVTAKDSTVANNLKAVRVGVSPRMGYSRKVSRADLSRIVRKQYLDADFSVHWSGSEIVKIRSRGAKHDTSSIVLYGQDYLLGFLASQGNSPARYEVEYVGDTKDIQLPYGKVTYRARIAEQAVVNSRMCVWVDIMADGDYYRTVPVWFSVDALMPVYVVKRDTKARAPLKRRHLRVEERDIAGLGSPPLAISDDLGPVWLTHHKAKAEIVLQKDVELMPSVKSKDNVVVMVTSGPIRIETIGIAKADGKLGDLIRIKNPDGNGSYIAKVIGDGVVHVQ